MRETIDERASYECASVLRMRERPTDSQRSRITKAQGNYDISPTLRKIKVKKKIKIN